MLRPRNPQGVTEVASLAEYHRLSSRLRELGFREDQGEDAPICRWISDRVVLDVMPTRPEVLGFGNEWYQPALEAAACVELPSGKLIRLVSAPYFLGTKLAAFTGRGKGDYLMSRDMEDVTALLDGRPTIVDEVLQADEVLREHLVARFSALMSGSRFVESLAGPLPGDAASQARLPFVLDRIAAITQGT